jgi:tetratricopeptide (TPR) repeat protein
MRAESALKTGDTQAAIPDLRTILRATPNAKQALLMLINAYADSGEDQLAIRTYRDYLNVDPENDLIRVEFAQRLMNAKKFDEADKQITQILQRSPKFVPALLTRINQRIIQKNWLEAVEVANRIIQDAGDEMEGRAALGKIYLAQGQAKKAIGELQRVNAAKPGPSEARSMLIQALIQDHQSVQAIGLLTKSTAADPKDADAFDLLGDVYFTLNRPDEALEALKQCIKARPKWDLPYLKLISLDMKMGQQTEAAELARAALKEMPNHPQLLLNLAMIEDARDQFDAAREAYEAVLKQQPRNLIAANNLAALIADAWPKDKVRLEQARRLAEPFRNSNDPVLLDTLGWVQYRLGNIDDAIEILERSAKAKPELAEIRYHLGMAYKAHGDQARARLELELATTSAPMYRGLQDAKLTLDNL